MESKVNPTYHFYALVTPAGETLFVMTAVNLESAVMKSVIHLGGNKMVRFEIGSYDGKVSRTVNEDQEKHFDIAAFFEYNYRFYCVIDESSRT